MIDRRTRSCRLRTERWVTSSSSARPRRDPRGPPPDRARARRGSRPRRRDVSRSPSGDGGPQVTADMNAREPIVAFGVDVAAAVFALVDPTIELEVHAPDGARVDRGGAAADGARARRTACSPPSAPRSTSCSGCRGVATLAKRYADAVARHARRGSSTRARRRPGFRVLEKAAVLAGGCGEPSLRSRLGHPDQGQPHRRVRLGARRGRGREGAGRRIRCASRSRSPTSASSTRRSRPARRSCCSTT